MAEYIEKEAAIHALKTAAEEYDKRVYDIAVCAGLNTAIRVIKALPDANVRENVKGKWNKRDSWFWYCSACGEPLRVMTDGIDNFDKEPNYCPNCGADMRGGNDG